MQTETLRDLFADQLHDLHSMESQLTEAMPRLMKFCHDDELKQAIANHAYETARHRAIILQIVENLGIPIEDDPSKAIAGLVEGGEEHLEEVREPHVRDMMMVAHCLRIEHYEIAAYEITSRLGERLGLEGEARRLRDNLGDERATAKILTGLESRLQEVAQQMAGG